MAKNHLRSIHEKPLVRKFFNTRKLLPILLIALISLMGITIHADDSYAAGCPDIKVIFARGSGGERYTNDDYRAFKSSIQEKLNTSNLSYDIDDLDYPAVSIDATNGHLDTLLNAYIGSGEAYDFGDSVHAGVKELLRVVNTDTCKNTKYVFAGYSQGAIVLLDGLKKINPSRVIYVATFGDPKIYLPEGAGPVPKACSGKNLSDYRIYVPDCKAYQGILGGRKPYVPSGYTGKVGTWCNRYDVLCSSYYGIKSHTSYVQDGLYEDASRFVFSKIAQEFHFKNQYTSPHDTAILIDSTGSMESLISRYKNEALRLAEKTLNSGGRVALYDYKDVGDEYIPVERCNFETCNLETFRAGLDSITVGGGGDKPESVLSASLHVMKKLKWKFGSTKSLIILTDAGYHSPDLDGTTFYDVVKLSKQIDPVNFYIITKDKIMPEYQTLADETGGMVVSTVDDLGSLTDTIMDRYDSLPRVEEVDESELNNDPLPVLNIIDTQELSDSELHIHFNTNGIKTIVVINDAIMGTVTGDEITIGNLKRNQDNQISLVPLSNSRRGETVTLTLASQSTNHPGFTMPIPKTPNTGKH